MRTFSLCVIGWFVVTTCVGPAAAEQPDAAVPEAEQPPPRIVSVASVLSALRKESMRWHRDKTFPRSSADFAQDRNVDLPDEDVIRMLGRKLHKEPAIDAYLKWQLMSFEPDLSGLSAGDTAHLIKMLPKIEKLPGPADDTNRRVAQAMAEQQARRHAMAADDAGANPAVVGGIPAGSDPTLSVVQEGAVLDATATVNPGDPRYVTMTVRADNADVVDIRQVPVAAANAEAANAFAADARDAAIAALPDEGGVQLVAMFADLRDRIVAGDDSYAAASVALAEASDRIGEDITLTPELRTQMLDWTAALSLMRTPVYRVEPIEGTLTDRVEVDWVHVADHVIRRLADNLVEPKPEQPDYETAASEE